MKPWPLLLLASCTVEPTSAPSLCPQACDRLQELGCPEGDDCLEYCERYGMDHDLACLAKVETCDEIAGCE